MAAVPVVVSGRPAVSLLPAAAWGLPGARPLGSLGRTKCETLSPALRPSSQVCSACLQALRWKSQASLQSLREQARFAISSSQA